MPEFLRIAAMLREQMQAELTRSDVLRVLIWPILILVLAGLGAISMGAPALVLIGIAVFAGLFLLIYAASFVAMLIYDRDALRTEKYNLQKLAIEHGVYGDSTQGQLEPPVKKPDEVIELSPADKGQ